MSKVRKWKLFGIVGLLIGGLAVLASRVIKSRKLRQPIY
jgi:hypothetical protein